MQHYLKCRRLHSFGTNRLLLPAEPQPEARTLAALLLQPRSALEDEVLTRRALLLAAAYRLHCTHRRGRPFADEEALQRALEQAVKQAAMGHPAAVRCLDGRWLPRQLRPHAAREQ